MNTSGALEVMKFTSSSWCVVSYFFNHESSDTTEKQPHNLNLIIVYKVFLKLTDNT